MRPARTRRLTGVVEDDRGDRMSLLPWAHRLWDTWGLRLCTLSVILAFTSLIAASGPHLVHHLMDLPRPADHHTHADAPRPPDCVVFSLTQHTPVAEGVRDSLPMPLPLGKVSVIERPIMVRAALWSLVLARAPPA
jgi:hypothetical protein